MSSLANVKYLLVDLDGTLLGARDLPLRIDFIVRSARALRSHGGVLRALRSIYAIKKEISNAPAEVIKDVTNEKRVASAFASAIGLPLEEASLLLEDVMNGLFPMLKKHFFPVKNAKAFLVWAKERYPMTLATEPIWPEPIVRLRLEWAGIDPSWFELITHAKIMHATKPSRQYYQEVLSHIGRSPSECLLIGNEMSKDLPAIRVGIPVYIVAAQKELKKLNTPKDRAPAWTGTFQHLRSLLSAESESAKIG